jgi:endonuclease/exonuclease/phosphatase family metal-dependent hydrolase
MIIKLLSYNIKVGAETSTLEVARTVAAIGADIVALQEVGCKWLWGDRGDGMQAISSIANLPHTRFAPALASFLGGAFGVGVASRLPIVDHKIIYLERHVDEPRVLLQSEIALDDERRLRVFTTHLSYKEDRVWQAKQIAKAIGVKGPPAILLGDINSEPEENLHNIAAPGFVDAFAQCGQGTGFTFATNDPKWRIDYAMIDPGLQIVSCRVLAHKASDHFPLLVEVEI